MFVQERLKWRQKNQYMHAKKSMLPLISIFKRTAAHPITDISAFLASGLLFHCAVTRRQLTNWWMSLKPESIDTTPAKQLVWMVIVTQYRVVFMRYCICGSMKPGGVSLLSLTGLISALKNWSLGDDDVYQSYAMWLIRKLTILICSTKEIFFVDGTKISRKMKTVLACCDILSHIMYCTWNTYEQLWHSIACTRASLPSLNKQAHNIKFLFDFQVDLNGCKFK